MKHTIIILTIGLIGCSVFTESRASLLLGSSDGDEFSASTARNLRAKTRYHFTLANEAQNKMLDAENNNDIDSYEKWRAVMRDEDDKMLKYAAQYEEVRDVLESKIWTGEIEIKGFQLAYEKGNLESIIDHLTFRNKP